MIYKFTIRNDKNEDKLFYLTADDYNQLYKRVLFTYGYTRESINILEEYKETADDGYELVTSHVASLSKKDVKVREKAKEIFAKQSRKCDPWKTEYKEKYNFKDEIVISSEKDLYDLIPKYKKIKVYWESGEKRGQHRIYALCK